MADDTGSKDEQTSAADSGVTVKRRLKNPVTKGASETVRERTAKHRKLREASTESTKTSKFGSFVYGFTWPMRWVGRQISKLGRFRVFRIIGRILLPLYIRNSWRELRQVTWPDRRTSWKLTYAVIVFSVIFGVIVFAVDTVLDKLFKEIILK